MKKLLLIMFLVFGLSMPCLAGPPTRVVWGESPEENVAGYYVYHGVAPGVYPNAVKIEGKVNTCFMLSDLSLVPEVKNYIAVTAYNTEGGESGYSEMLIYPLLEPVSVSIQDDGQDTIITIAIPNCP